MGQHSSPSEWHFYRSVVMWFLPWLVIAGVIGVAVWIGVDALGGDDNGPVVATRSPSPGPTTPSPEESTPDTKPSPTETPSPKDEPSSEATPDETQKLITEGVSVQVLNGSSIAGAETTIGDRLDKLGFDVVAVAQSSAAYPRTTVFWSFAEAKPAAKALAGRFGWVAEPKPENLSASVDLHVVVGEDAN